MARTALVGDTVGTLHQRAFRVAGARPARWLALAAAAAILAGCDGNYAAKEENIPRPGPKRQYNPDYDVSVFGEGGLAIGTIGRDRGLFGFGEDEGGRLPVNKYLWQASLDTLSFLPLASTDPFTGVIATDWSASPTAPGERFKVTAFITSSALSAGALKVATYREVRNEDGVWVPAPVSPDTARQLEDAILVRAREIRIAEREGRTRS